MNQSVWISGLVAALLIYQIGSIPALWLKKNDLADVFWGPAFPLSLTAAIFWGRDGGFSALDARSALVLILVAVWALRLLFHIGLRNLTTLEEDVRYRNWRKEWGRTQVWRSYLQVWCLQPLILFVFLVPALFVIAGPSQSMGALTALGVLIWIFGFLFEAIGDEQLRQFKKNTLNKGKLMTEGLWSWTRHPNYFGEVTQWWGIWLIAAELPHGWMTVVAPICLTYLIWNVSGVSMLEDLMKNRPGFKDYARRTSRFFPRPPRQ